MSTINILVVEDHEIVSDGIKMLIEDEENFQVKDIAHTGEDALKLCEEKEIDVVLMDISLPTISGIEATRQITSKFPETRVIALTMMDEQHHIQEMRKAGAMGYVIKSCSQQELIDAIYTVDNGEPYLSDDAVKKIFSDSQDSSGNHFGDPERLTDREVEILQLIVNELTNKEIADRLDISVRTVDSHRRNLLEKTGARNTAGLVSFAFRHDITSS